MILDHVTLLQGCFSDEILCNFWCCVGNKVVILKGNLLLIYHEVFHSNETNNAPFQLFLCPLPPKLKFCADLEVAFIPG